MNHKSFILISLLLFSTIPLFSQKKDIKISGEYKGDTFFEFVTEVEKHHNIRFFFNPDWIENITIDNNYSDILLSEILETTLSDSGINFFIDETGYVILSGEFVIKSRADKSEQDTNYIYRQEAVVPVEEKSEIDFQVIEIGMPSGDNRGNVTLSGYVKDIDTGEPVIGAVFQIDELKAGTVTNQYGYYSLTLPKGNYHARFSCLGMKTVTRQINIYATGNTDIYLKEKLIPLGSITVTADGNARLSRMEIGLEKLSIKTIKLLPTSMGEADIIKTALLLPGVQTVGEGASGFHVRGGSSDQNLVLLYDVPVFNTSHFFGFFPSVNSDIISDISLYKGGIPAKYGGRISSVLHIIPKDGNKKKITGSGGISPVTSRLMIEGPIIKDRTSFLVAGRSTYSNWLLNLMEDTWLHNSKASFYDASIRIVHEINNNNNLEFSSYLSHDAFNFNYDTLYSYNNNLLSFKWRHIFNDQLFAVFSVNHSHYDYNISSSRDKINSFELLHDVNYSELKMHLTYYPNYKHQIDLGFDLGKYRITPGELIPLGDSSLIVPNIIEKQFAISPAVFISDEIKIFDRLSVNAGIRFSSFFVTGPSTVLQYHPDFTRSESSVIDTLLYSSGSIIKKYFRPEIRLSLNYMIGANSSVKINYNTTTQYIHQLSNTTSISPTDIWILSDTYVKPQRGEQIALGLYTNLFNNNLEISLEGYYKEIKNMIDFKGGARLLLNTHMETDIINAFGKARGIEFMVKKSKGRVNGWVSYTYSRILIKSITQFPEEEINSGEYFPANYDKPHDLSVIFNYIFSRRFSFSSTYTYSTGRPITFPIASYNFAGTDILHYSDRNQYRIPDYSRLDISVTIDGNLKIKKLAHSTLTFSVYNLLGRDNVYSIYFDTKNNLVEGYKLSVFARPIPSVSYNFKF